MKKTWYVTAAVSLLAVFGGCYNEVELEPRKAGDVLPIAGAYNVRDVGGYVGAGGKRVKSGKLIRSGDLNMLTQRDRDYLFGELGVKTVVDFRSKKYAIEVNDEGILNRSTSSEQSSSPDRVPDGVSIEKNATAIDESIVVPEYESIISDTSLYPDIQSVITAVETGYKRIVGFNSDNSLNNNNAKNQYKAFFQRLLASDPDGDNDPDPLLYHCSAGKDRTGVATMLLLSALGVDKETIINDYFLSAGYVEEKYYPVAPYVIKSTKNNMKQQRDSPKVQQPGQILTSGNEQAIAGLKASMQSKIEPATKASVITNVKVGLVEAGMDINQVNSMTETQLDGILQTQSKPTIAQTTQGAIAQKGGIEAMVEAQCNQIKSLYKMRDAEIEGFAENAGEKVKPLLTVRREYIEATFSAIEAAYSTSNTPVLEYVKDQTNGLGLSDADIAKLKALYLE
jgi:hypothetical protein